MVQRTGTAELVRLLGGWQDPALGPAEALHRALADLVDDGALPAGTRLPAQRDTAAALAVARGTVDRAYRALEHDGLVVSRRGSGTFVQVPALRRDGDGLPRRTGRLRTFTAAERVDLDLSSGALPAASGVGEVFAEVAGRLAADHLHHDGYFPAGLPELRTALAAHLTAAGVRTAPEQLLVTAGSQQAVWLVAHTLLGHGDTVVTEDPTYRGALEAFTSAGAQVRGVPMTSTGVDPQLLRGALDRAPRLLYLQTALHNPTGVHSTRQHRAEVARLSARNGTLVVDDQSSADLPRTRSGRFGGLDGLVDPDRLITVGTASKLFWGGLRVGWVRAAPATVRLLTDTRRVVDLGSSVADQIAVTLLLSRADALRRERRDLLAEQYRRTAEALADDPVSAGWTWQAPAGGSGLWVDTGRDTVRLATRARAAGVRLAAGPAFSCYDGHRTRLRVPLWHEPGQLAQALRRLR